MLYKNISQYFLNSSYHSYFLVGELVCVFWSLWERPSLCSETNVIQPPTIVSGTQQSCQKVLESPRTQGHRLCSHPPVHPWTLPGPNPTLWLFSNLRVKLTWKCSNHSTRGPGRLSTHSSSQYRWGKTEKKTQPSDLKLLSRHLPLPPDCWGQPSKRGAGRWKLQHKDAGMSAGRERQSSSVSQTFFFFF